MDQFLNIQFEQLFTDGVSKVFYLSRNTDVPTCNPEAFVAEVIK